MDIGDSDFYDYQNKPKVRNNKQIQRMARYLFDNSWEVCHNWTDPVYEWETAPEIRDHYYDLAVKLFKKLQNYEFTGEDDHE